MDGIEALGFDDTTPIQAQAIPPVLEGKDIIACAQTGTGKTAAYLIPTLQRLMEREHRGIRALILAPTRELAEQIDYNIEALGYFTGIASFAVIGGKDAGSFDRQKFAITNGADIIVATPGRLIIYLALGMVDFSAVEVLILDEADKMLDMGFYADIIKISQSLPTDRQTLMFSATMPSKIRSLAREILRDPIEEINLNIAKPAAGINQLAYMIHEDQKIPLLERLIREREVESMIIFASSKLSVDRIAKKLSQLNYNVRAMHSDKTQQERQETLRDFKNRVFPILVGTDVLARGIDIDNLSHVLNYDVPHDAEDYVHRVGRTARASATGEAITFITPKDQHRFVRIERLIDRSIPKPEIPAELGEAPAYAPPSRRGGGEGRGENRGEGRGEGRGDRSNKRRGGPKDGKPRQEQAPASPVEAAVKPPEGEQIKKKKKKKRRRPAGPRGPQEGGQPTPPPAV